MQKHDSENVNGFFLFDPKDLIYQDHFPGNPVVPGSLIVHAFITAAKQAGFNDGTCTVENFRFKKFIPPGKYPFSIKVTRNQLECSIFDQGNVIATGTVST